VSKRRALKVAPEIAGLSPSIVFDQTLKLATSVGHPFRANALSI
jgi:hypothetical protein